MYEYVRYDMTENVSKLLDFRHSTSQIFHYLKYTQTLTSAFGSIFINIHNYGS